MTKGNTMRRYYIAGPSIHEPGETVYGFLYATENDRANETRECPEEMAGFWIEHVCAGKTRAGVPISPGDSVFRLLLERAEWTTGNLIELELRLMMWARAEMDADGMAIDMGRFDEFGIDGLTHDAAAQADSRARTFWASQGDSTELNEFIRQYCAAHTIACDGDVFGMMFSGPADGMDDDSAWPVGEAIRRIEEGAYLYNLRKGAR